MPFVRLRYRTSCATRLTLTGVTTRVAGDPVRVFEKKIFFLRDRLCRIFTRERVVGFEFRLRHRVGNA